ncbi:oligosaccharide flippase family protein [Massilia sp. PWRC2]|uniref:oligosaccharide flippase family protein n=1 Tax=Massilia sp. PWRC2 TaxID=2804626 RepID=UPI003CF9B374
MLKFLFKDSVYYFFGSIAFQVSGLVAVILMMRSLKIEEFGVYSYCVALVALFAFIADGGLSQYLIKKITQSPRTMVAIYREMQGAQVYISLIILLSLSVFAFAFHALDEAYIIFLLGAGVVISGYVTPMFSLMIARGEKKQIMKKDFYLALGRLIFVLFVSNYFPSVLAFAFCNLALASISLIYCLNIRAIPGNEFMFGFSLRRESIKRVLVEGLPFTVLMLANVLYNRVDVIMLKRFAGVTEVGIYNGAAQFVFPFMFVSSVLVSAIFPHLSRHAESSLLLGKMRNSSFWLMTLSGLALSLFLFFFSDIFFRMMFANKFNASIGVFKVLVWYLFIVFAYGTFSNILVVKNKTILLFWVTVGTLLLKIALNYLFIPGYGAMSAAMSTLICEALLFVITLALAWRFS